MCKAAYIHVPFCQNICAYCDFFRCRYQAELAEKWLTVITQEIQETLNDSLKTLYIGGGTPSALHLEQLETLLQTVFPYAKDCQEVTMEANVESLSAEKLACCAQYGVNRISLGVQTLQPDLLARIHRSHTRAEVLACLQQIHAARIHNISIDLIYGLPQQTLQQWKSDLEDIVQHFPIQHISLYALTIEEHSEFGRKGIAPADPYLEEDMYEMAIQILKAHGFYQYEISSFARDGYRSYHNQMYWRYEDFYGIGCGASGKRPHQRYDNTRNLDTYLKQGASPTTIPLTLEDEMFEMLMMSLRMRQGLDCRLFERRFHRTVESVYGAVIQQQIARGYLIKEEQWLYATERGFHLLNDVLIEFLPES